MPVLSVNDDASPIPGITIPNIGTYTMPVSSSNTVKIETKSLSRKPPTVRTHTLFTSLGNPLGRFSRFGWPWVVFALVDPVLGRLELKTTQSRRFSVAGKIFLLQPGREKGPIGDPDAGKKLSPLLALPWHRFFELFTVKIGIKTKLL